MKLVKIFGVVMSVHAAVFLFIFAIPGCRSTGKKPAASASVTGSDSSPLAASEMGSTMSDPAPAADLAPGDVLTAENLRAIRPGLGLPPKYLDQLLGRTVRQAVPRGSPMRWDYLS